MRITRLISRGVVDGFVDRFVDWAVESQQVARRNALVSSTEMADRRRERIEVEEFLAAHELAFQARRANSERPIVTAAG